VATFLPDAAPSPRARADMVAWYVDAMTEWSEFWVASTRRHFPETEINLCTGGDANPFLGADFTAQALTIEPHDAGIRITNEASEYGSNFVVTREVATACRSLGVPYGFEPAGRVDELGVIARIYNATASGATHLQYYADNVLGKAEAMDSYRAWAGHLQRREPTVHAGVYLPKTSWAIDPDTIWAGYDLARRIRDWVDVDLVDYRMLEGDRLPDLKVLVGAGAGEPALMTPDGGPAFPRGALAEPPADLIFAWAGIEGDPPPHFALDVGTASDDVHLFGDWHNRETGPEWRELPGATKRWSGARSGALVPIDPSADATLVIDCFLSPHSFPGENRVLVNGEHVGDFEGTAPGERRFAVPVAALKGRAVAEVTLEINTWRPSDHGSDDGRWLGVGVREIRMFSNAAELSPAAATPILMSLDRDAVVEHCVRRLGKGAVVVLPPDPRTAQVVGEAVVLALSEPQAFGCERQAVPVPAPAADGVYITTVADGLLMLNWTDEARTVLGVDIPAHGIAHAEQ